MFKIEKLCCYKIALLKVIGLFDSLKFLDAYFVINDTQEYLLLLHFTYGFLKFVKLSAL